MIFGLRISKIALMAFAMCALLYTPVRSNDFPPEVRILGERLTAKLSDTIENLHKVFYSVYNQTSSQSIKIYKTVYNYQHLVFNTFHGYEVMREVEILTNKRMNVTKWKEETILCAAELDHPMINIFDHIMACVKKSKNHIHYINHMILMYNSVNDKIAKIAEDFLACSNAVIKTDDFDPCFIDVTKNVYNVCTEIVPSMLEYIKYLSYSINDIPRKMIKCYKSHPLSSHVNETLLLPEVVNCLVNKIS